MLPSTVNVPNRLPLGKRWLVGNVRLLNALVTSWSECSSTYQSALPPNIVLSSAVTKHQKKAELKGLVSNWRKTVPSQKPWKAPETFLIPTVWCSVSRSSISLNNDTRMILPRMGLQDQAHLIKMRMKVCYKWPVL